MRLRYLLARAPYVARNAREYATETALIRDTLALHAVGETDATPIIGYGTVAELLATYRATHDDNPPDVPAALVDACTRSWGAL